MTTQQRWNEVKLDKEVVEAAIKKYQEAHIREMRKKTDATPTSPSEKVVRNRV